jgi:hypothetical protein
MASLAFLTPPAFRMNYLGQGDVHQYTCSRLEEHTDFGSLMQRRPSFCESREYLLAGLRSNRPKRHFSRTCTGWVCRYLMEIVQVHWPFG